MSAAYSLLFPLFLFPFLCRETVDAVFKILYETEEDFVAVGEEGQQDDGAGGGGADAGEAAGHGGGGGGGGQLVGSPV